MFNEIGRVLAYFCIGFALAMSIAACGHKVLHQAPILDPAPNYKPFPPVRITVGIDENGDCMIIERRGDRAVQWLQKLCDPWTVAGPDEFSAAD